MRTVALVLWNNAVLSFHRFELNIKEKDKTTQSTKSYLNVKNVYNFLQSDQSLNMSSIIQNATPGVSCSKKSTSGLFKIQIDYHLVVGKYAEIKRTLFAMSLYDVLYILLLVHWKKLFSAMLLVLR